MPGFWGIVVSNALMVCFLAVVALLLGRGWKNRAALHLVWLAVLIKLFVPPVFTAELPGTAPWMVAAIESHSFSEFWNSGASAPGGLAGDAAARPAVWGGPANGLANPGDAPAHSAPAHSAAAHSAAAHSAAATANHRSWPLSSVLAAVWVFGTACMTVWYAWRIGRFRRLLGDAEPAADAVTALAGRIGESIGLARIPKILMTPHALPPLVWSLGGAPAVILPAGLFDRLSPAARETILAHELAHVRRKDHRVRLLELAATTLFWWHPVVWLACSQLRRLEEECCDSRVLEMVPGKARVYAATLVDTLDFLSERPNAPVPLPTAAGSTATLSRRIRMLTQRRTHRLTIGSVLVVASITALPLAIALAADQPAKQPNAADRSNAPGQPNDADAPQASGDAAQAGPVVAGRVTDAAGEPLAAVLVKVAAPAEDMRFAFYQAGFKAFEAGTDKDGKYRLELPAGIKATTASVDAMKPGYRSLAGTLMQGGDNRVVDISAGSVAQASFALEPALYVKGIVVDEHDKPIAGVKIHARAAFEHASGGIEITASRADGSFEIFNYPLQPVAGDERFKGIIGFEHPAFIAYSLADIYPMTAEQRESVRVVMAAGHKIAGKVLDAGGQPVAGVMVEASREDDADRKAVLSDADGQFVLRGMVSGATTILVHDMKLKQKITFPLTLDRDYSDVELRLVPIVLAAEPRSVDVLGMKLTNVTPELRSAYDLGDQRGALILDPGKDSARLDIGELKEGYCFWMVGERRVSSVRQFVDRILAETADQDGDEYRCRIVYSFRKLEFVGTNTQYLKLTKADLEQLRKVAAELAGE